MRFPVVILCLLAPALAAPNSVRLWSRSHGRIIGGTETTVSQYPWQLSLIYMGSHKCGASVISANWALTTSWCLDKLWTAHLALRAGSTYRNSGGIVLGVAQAIMNEDYDYLYIDYDIAVVQPAEPFPLGSDIQPVGLPEAGYDPPAGLAVTMTGWGLTSVVEDFPPDVLHKVDVNVVDRATCREHFVFKVTERMVCAGEEDKTACFGDVGSPVVSGSTQVAIISWGGFSCEDYGVVCTNVGELRDWVTNTTGV